MAVSFGSLGRDQAVLRLLEEEEERQTLTGTTFEETLCKSALNHVPGDYLPFNWTVNPYRGCAHACVYCFARPTHTYLGLDLAEDFERHIVVKVNVAAVLRRELAAARWAGELVALGTNTDPYQRAERRYRLTRSVLSELAEARNPVSITTKSPSVLADLDLLERIAAEAGAGVNLSVGTLDEQTWRALEPQTARPQRRLEAVARLNAAGVRAGVLVAPILPHLTDSEDQLSETIALAAESGAVHAAPVVLHLRPGVREHFMAWLEQQRPDLVPRYERLYRRGAYADPAYRRRIGELVAGLRRRHGIDERRSRRKGPAVEARAVARRRAEPPLPPTAPQLTLL